MQVVDRPKFPAYLLLHELPLVTPARIPPLRRFAVVGSIAYSNHTSSVFGKATGMYFQHVTRSDFIIT